MNFRKAMAWCRWKYAGWRYKLIQNQLDDIRRLIKRKGGATSENIADYEGVREELLRAFKERERWQATFTGKQE